jgi:hypothetical protein
MKINVSQNIQKCIQKCDECHKQFKGLINSFIYLLFILFLVNFLDKIFEEISIESTINWIFCLNWLVSNKRQQNQYNWRESLKKVFKLLETEQMSK